MLKSHGNPPIFLHTWILWGILQPFRNHSETKNTPWKLNQASQSARVKVSLTAYLVPMGSAKRCIPWRHGHSRHGHGRNGEIHGKKREKHGKSLENPWEKTWENLENHGKTHVFFLNEINIASKWIVEAMFD